MSVASREFQVFVKPAGAACNLECSYCYYLAKSAGQAGIPRMPDDLLDIYIQQHIDASLAREIRFSWHGGEPTLLGLDYFRRIVAIQKRAALPGRHIVNGIQTNGLLLDEAWAAFFAEQGFRVGLSIDGPADLHDQFRLTRGKGPSHASAVRAFELLQRHGVSTDILCVVHASNVGEPLRVYRFFRKMGVRALGFLPVVKPEPGPTGVSTHTVPAEAYGEFLCAIFDEWVERDSRRIVVQMFEEATRPARGLEHGLCIFRATCGDVPVVEHDGAFYSCDHFVDQAHRLGSIVETPLVQLLEAPAQRAFGLSKRGSLPRECLECDVLPMCNGGCPKDRFARAPDGEAGLNYLCPAFKRFFTHALPWAVRIGLESRSIAAPTNLLRVPPPAAPSTGRNDPCPCGSGRKYKKCCGRD